MFYWYFWTGTISSFVQPQRDLKCVCFSNNNDILGSFRFAGWDPGRRLGLQCSSGPISDPVPDPRLVSVLDHCSW